MKVGGEIDENFLLVEISSYKVAYGCPKITSLCLWLCACSLSELHALLLNDILVLLEKHDEKFYLRCHTAETVSGNKEEYSPVYQNTRLLAKTRSPW